MPELPEVETTLRAIEKFCKSNIKEIKVHNRNLRWKVDKNLELASKNQLINKLSRRAKYIIFHLENNNIMCAIHYPKPFYESIAYEHVKVENCEIMENVKDKLLSLPMYPELSGNEVEYVCEKINSFYE